MPLVYQQNINAVTKIGVWHISESEDFFRTRVPLQREITHWHKRLQHFAGRLLLKELYPEFPLEFIQIADTRKPFLQNEPFHFSISHCSDYAAVIVSREYRVGVDIERITDKVAKIVPRFLSAEECLLLPRETVNETATLCWGVKESIFKWISMGGVDFKKDIVIKKISGRNEGTVHCVVKDSAELKVHFLVFNNNYLTWLVT